MLAPRLFEKIGYRPEWILAFHKLYPALKEHLAPLAERIISEHLPVEEAQAQLAERFSWYPEETLCLMLLLEASGLLYEQYRKARLPEEMFYDAMRDLTCKTRECERLKGVFGTFVPRWYNGFYHMTRFAFGRLQFDLSSYQGKNVLLAGVNVAHGAFCLQCHIPSLGPLTEQEWMRSLSCAQAFFADRFPEHTLIVTCRSYLLFPSYFPLFAGTAPNITRFASRFWIESTAPQDVFRDAWRVFYQQEGTPPEKLPAETALQRAFIRYMQTSEYFGEGVGVLVYQNKTILTKNQYA